MYPYILQLLKW